jgi:hypothetical protein
MNDLQLESLLKDLREKRFGVPHRIENRYNKGHNARFS